jgi:GMP synthase (glutamine-hydrolysing)
VRILSIVHEPSSTGGGGLFERLVVERGDQLDRWVAADDEPAPGAPSEWDAVMVFGGTMHPNQDAEHPWLAGELGFIERALADRVPMIGVCLGAQLTARAGGAWVGPAPSAEAGWFTVDVNADGLADPVLGVLPDRIDAFQWHYFTFGLPDGAVALASSPAALQAYRLGDRIWGIQFHAEVERHMLESWFSKGRAELGKPLDEIWAETDRLLPTWNAHGRALCSAFLDEASRLRS